jgi:hypothetical protein
MDLTFQTTRRYTIPTAFQAEEQIAFYLNSIFNETKRDFTVASMEVKVKNEGTITDDRSVLQTVVTMYYIAQQPITLTDMLIDRVNTQELADRLELTQLSLAYDDLVPTLELAYVPDYDDGRPKADKGLIALTVFMAVALILVASAVLYITGGWAAFQQCCINCLFEEIEEDDYAVAKKSTFQVQSFDEGDGTSKNGKDNHDFDVASQAPSEITDATGMLGGQPNPAAGMGIKTPSRSDTSGFDSELNMTPYSETTQNNTSTHNPLGIASLRKLPRMDDSMLDNDTDDDVEGGLAHLILKRRFKENHNKAAAP